MPKKTKVKKGVKSVKGTRGQRGLRKNPDAEKLDSNGKEPDSSTSQKIQDEEKPKSDECDQCPDLPSEVLENIFSLLDTYCLMDVVRFVSKSWGKEALRALGKRSWVKATWPFANDRIPQSVARLAKLPLANQDGKEKIKSLKSMFEKSTTPEYFTNWIITAYWLEDKGLSTLLKDTCGGHITTLEINTPNFYEVNSDILTKVHTLLTKWCPNLKSLHLELNSVVKIESGWTTPDFKSLENLQALIFRMPAVPLFSEFCLGIAKACPNLKRLHVLPYKITRTWLQDQPDPNDPGFFGLLASAPEMTGKLEDCGWICCAESVNRPKSCYCRHSAGNGFPGLFKAFSEIQFGEKLQTLRVRSSALNVQLGNDSKNHLIKLLTNTAPYLESLYLYVGLGFLQIPGIPKMQNLKKLNLSGFPHSLVSIMEFLKNLPNLQILRQTIVPNYPAVPSHAREPKNLVIDQLNLINLGVNENVKEFHVQTPFKDLKSLNLVLNSIPFVQHLRIAAENCGPIPDTACMTIERIFVATRRLQRLRALEISIREGDYKVKDLSQALGLVKGFPQLRRVVVTQTKKSKSNSKPGINRAEIKLLILKLKEELFPIYLKVCLVTDGKIMEILKPGNANYARFLWRQPDFP